MSTLPVFSQKFKNVDVNFTGSMVNISYELEGFEYDQQYEVYLFGSQNQFKEPLLFVKGDVGQKVHGNANLKKIEWDAKKELGSFDGNISLELRGKPYIPFLKLSTDIDNQSFKRGKSYLLEWSGAEGVQNLDFQIMVDKEVKSSAKNVLNKNSLNWTIPKNIKPGRNYSLKISNTNNSLEWISTNTFQVKRKVPVVVLFSPVLLGGAYFLIPKEPNGSSGIPDPPAHPIQ